MDDGERGVLERAIQHRTERKNRERNNRSQDLCQKYEKGAQNQSEREQQCAKLKLAREGACRAERNVLFSLDYMFTTKYVTGTVLSQLQTSKKKRGHAFTERERKRARRKARKKMK